MTHPASAHAAGVFGVLTTASVVAVYGLGLAEIAVPSVSLLSSLALSAWVAVASGGGFLVAVRGLRRRASRARATVLGVLVGLVVAAMYWLAPGRVDLAKGSAAALMFSGLATLACPRAASERAPSR